MRSGRSRSRALRVSYVFREVGDSQYWLMSPMSTAGIAVGLGAAEAAVQAY